MAAKKSTKKTSRDGPKAVVVFWIIFTVVIVSIAFFNWPTITKNFNLFKTRLANPPGTEEELIEETEEKQEERPSGRTPPAPEVVVIESDPKPKPPEQKPAVTAEKTEKPAVPAAQQTKPETQTTQTTKPPDPPAPPSPPAVQTRDRSIYFAQVNNDGQILQSKVVRKIPVSETPMQDVLNAMLAGPNAAELGKNVLNMIPKNTKLLSATVRGSTAYLNFSEDFMFNSYGVEGYVAQLRQIVWTVTEFPNVRDVQILIEGRRVDYLAEGIWIGSPLGRQ